MKYSYFFIACVFLLFPCAAWAQDVSAIERLGSGEINWKDGIITTTGIGIAPPTMPAMQAKAMAKRAAISVGMRNLLETVKGVAIDSESTVDNYMLKDDTIKARVSGIIQGAKILKVKTEPDGSVEVLMGLSLRGKLSDTFIPPTFGKFSPVSYSAPSNPSTTFSSPVIPSLRPPQAKPSHPSPSHPTPFQAPPPQAPLPQVDIPLEKPSYLQKPAHQDILAEQSSTPPTAPAPEMGEDPHTTGLIIDGTGLGLHPALVPKLLDEEGNEIYASKIVRRQIAVSQGVVGYSKDLVAASRQKRITNKPLIIKGLQAAGPKKTDIIISRNDVQKLQEAEQRSSFLQQARVVIVYD